MSTDKNQKSTDGATGALSRLRERVRSRLGEMRISAREASRRAGFNVGYVGDLLEGRSKAPELDRIIRLAETLELPVAELMGEAGSNEVPSTSDSLITNQQGSHDEGSGSGSRMIPLFAARIAMNKPFIPIEWKPVGFVPSLPSLKMIDGAYAVTVFNDLLAPRYFPGETIYVSPADTIRPGDFTFGRFKTGEAGYARLLRIEGERGIWELLNPGTYPRELVHRLDELEFLHRIVGSVG